MNKFEYEVSGVYGQFSDPLLKIGGEKVTYDIPTYSALVGITKAIYWKPTIEYVIDEVRVMNPIHIISKGMNIPIKLLGLSPNKNNEQANYTYLYNPKYRVRGHIVWNEDRPDMVEDRIMGKHINCFNRKLRQGGNHNICIGTTECGGLVLPIPFDEGKGYYDDTENKTFRLMFHSFIYPSINDEHLIRCFFEPVMHHGIIKFPSSRDCERKEIIQ